MRSGAPVVAAGSPLRTPAPALLAVALPALLALALSTLAPAAHAQPLPHRTESATAVGFWRSFGDPTLEALIGRALEANLDLRAAGARVDAARAERLSSALDLVPSITAVAGYSRQQLATAAVPGPGAGALGQELWDAGVQLSWEVDVFGRARRSLQARNALIDAAEGEVDDVGVLLAAEVALAYFDLRGARNRLAVAGRNARNQRETLEVTLDRLEAGRGTALDSERAQAQLSSTLAAIPLLETAVAAARHRIDVLLGRPPGSTGAELGEDSAPVTLPDTLALSISQALILSRPDVRSAEHRLAASSASVGSAKAEYLPRLSITGVAGYTAGAFDALGGSGTPRYAVGPVVSWPLLDLGRVQARVNAARADEAEAEARYESAILNARADVETALVAYHGTQARLRHLEEAAAASERATELARLRFDEGASDFLQVLDAERTQLDAQDRLALGRTEAMTALVAVYRALGGQWPDR